MNNTNGGTQPKLLTVREAADILRVAPRTVRDRISRGDLVASKPRGCKSWLIPEQILKTLVNEGVKA